MIWYLILLVVLGTTAHVCEQWGRRWITIDTSRVALALAQGSGSWEHGTPTTCCPTAIKAVERKQISARVASTTSPAHGDVRQGFVYARVPHVSLRDITNNAEIDVIWEEYQAKLEPVRHAIEPKRPAMNWQEWEIPRVR